MHSDFKANGYDFRRDGDDFLLGFPAAGITLQFQSLHERSDGLHGELNIESTLPDKLGHVHWARINLSSTSARESLCTMLRKRVQGPEWQNILEVACTKTAKEYRRGEPIINLAEAPKPAISKYLISRLLPAKSLSIFFGDGGSCKSLLALVLASAVTTNGHLPNGLRVLESGQVLYLDWETCYEDQWERLGALTLGMQLQDLPGIHYRRQTRSITDDARRLRADVDRLGIKLVIVDSLGPAVGASLRDEEQAIPAMNAINSLGTTALALAHITKADARNENAKATPIGSVFFSNLARSTWEVRKGIGADQDIVDIGLYHRKANRGPVQRDPIGFRFQFYGTSDSTDMITVASCDVSDDEELETHAPLAYRLHQLLKRGEMSAVDLAKATNAKEDTVRRSLNKMGDVVRIAGGKGQGNLSMWGLRHEVC